jgi:hypothetical protein
VTEPPSSSPAATPPPGRRRMLRTGGVIALGLLIVWAVVAYLVMPEAWKRYARRHPSLEDVPNVAYTGDGIPGDPLNSALVGTQHDVIRALLAAKWFPADPLSLKSSLEIVEASVLERPYAQAPVSNLYLFGRREDLAFEQPVGDDPRQRHHVRFWKTDKLDPDGRPVWVGSAIYDERVGLSRDTGEITHVTGPDIDAERDHLFDDLARGGVLIETYVVDDFHKILEGKNGGGDPWRTDGKLFTGVTKPGKGP